MKMLIFLILVFPLFYYSPISDAAQVIRASVGRSTLIETSAQTYAIVHPNLKGIDSDFLVVHGDILERFSRDCAFSSEKLDSTNAALHGDLENLRRSFEKGNLNSVQEEIPIVREIYESDGSLASRIEMGPRFQSSFFTWKNFKIHQSGSDFTYVTDPIVDSVERVFLVSGLLIQIFKDGQIQLDQVNCLPQARQSYFVNLLHNLQSATKIYHTCSDKYFSAVQASANGYHETVDRINSSISAAETELEKRDLEDEKVSARAAFDLERDALAKARAGCIKEIDKIDMQS